MIHLIVLATALLHLQDPVGDAVGDGTLAPPTAPVYANTADFDLQSVSVMDDPKLTVRVTLGSISNPGHLPNGFSSPIIEVYLDTGPGGSNALLPGSGMVMPSKRGWNVALRATGDQVYAVTPRSQGDPGSWPHLPASVEVQGNTLLIHTDLPRPDHADIYALTGVYDPFASDAWRPLTSSVSPWAFSSAKQRVPVVDLLASSQRAQRREIDSGVLAPYRPRTHGLGWLLLMVLGVIIAAAGTMLRRRVPQTRRPLALPPPPPRDPEERHRLPPFWGGMPPIERSFLDEVEDVSLWPEAFTSVGPAEGGPVAHPDRAPDGADVPHAGEQLVAEERADAGVEHADGDVSAPPPEEPARGVEVADDAEATSDVAAASGVEAAGDEPAADEPAAEEAEEAHAEAADADATAAVDEPVAGDAEALGGDVVAAADEDVPDDAEAAAADAPVPVDEAVAGDAEALGGDVVAAGDGDAVDEAEEAQVEAAAADAPVPDAEAVAGDAEAADGKQAEARDAAGDSGETATDQDVASERRS
ncbi:MAG: glucodextranase DOMON-like domain-containing protein [Deinococcales bacterium]